MEKFQEHLEKADSSLKTADHLVYITFPLIKENRLLKKILEGLGNSAYDVFMAILEYEYLYKRIRLYGTNKENFETFKRCAQRYNLTEEEVEVMNKIFCLVEKYKESSFEFIRKNKLVMMSENLKTESINLEQLKRHLNSMKSILAKTHAVLDKRPEYEQKEIKKGFRYKFRI
jgi:hypothetical protein